MDTKRFSFKEIRLRNQYSREQTQNQQQLLFFHACTSFISRARMNFQGNQYECNNERLMMCL